MTMLIGFDMLWHVLAIYRNTSKHVKIVLLCKTVDGAIWFDTVWAFNVQSPKD